MTTTNDNAHPDVTITLSSREAHAVFRALLEYRRLLSLSLLRERSEGLVQAEIARVDSVSEKISLADYFPQHVFGAHENG